MREVQKTPKGRRRATVHRFPRSERGRTQMRTRLANERYALPPSDGSVAEWRSWNGVTLRCGVCQQVTYPQMRLVLNLYGAYTLWVPCNHCHHLDEETAVPRQKIIELGRRLDGWAQVYGEQSLLEQRRHIDELLTHRRRAMTATYSGYSGYSGGGDRGA